MSCRAAASTIPSRRREHEPSQGQGVYESTEILRSFVRAVRQRGGATGASLYVPAASEDGGGPVLLHDGSPPGAPELVDLRSAAELQRTSRQIAGEDASVPTLASSRSECSVLLRLPAIESLLAVPAARTTQAATRKSRRRADQRRAWPQQAGWLALAFPAAEAATGAGRAMLAGSARGWHDLLALGAALVWHAQRDEGLPNDPTTGLPSRVELQVTLARAIEQAEAAAKPLTLLLVNPDEFVEVNERFGREAGDRAVREIADRIRSSLRSSDMVSKYGGAVFAAILTDTLRPEGEGVAEKLLLALTEGSYLSGALRLGFSVGAAVYDPGEGARLTALDLIRQADQALYAAKRSAGGRIVLWHRDSELANTENLDRLSGIFTANLAKDYRNMTLLWDTVSVVAGSADFTELARQAVVRLYETFKARRVGLFRWSDTGDPLLVHGQARPLTGAERSEPLPTFSLDETQRRLLEEARTRGEVTSGRADGGNGAPSASAYASPLIAGEDCLGCLFLDGHAEALALDSSDLIFLKALAGQLAVAFDRARLAEQERVRLRRELKGLRQALQASRLIYCSPQMEEVISTLRRVAPTDATVLIAGESGTGKELMARTLHELSPRRAARFVVVDCGAIAETLIDSELFGYERGAFTGARQRSIGRLAEAGGGTVLLDEIGELPLEVQSKLLRFVQEKQFTPVGGSRPHTVDVRVIAATNRDLPAEVAAGRFREDLYYRLNVVQLVMPPLRERPDDILFLATHWLERYSVQYHKPIARIGREAESLLVAHSWPGNVRELQNRIMQAVILCEGEELHPADLRLVEDGGVASSRLDERSPSSATPAASDPALPQGWSTPPVADASAGGGGGSDPWGELRSALGRQVDSVLRLGNGLAVPLGKWLEDDLVLEAYDAAHSLFRGGAELLGVPETTFRRKVHKARTTADAGLSMRLPEWEAMRPAIVGVVRAAEESSDDRLRRAREALLDEVTRRLPGDSRLGAGLLGVTPQTYRRWTQDRP
jgi:diguanylate cyclase (GGDEF)-like protein